MRPLTEEPVTFSIEFITPVKEQLYMMILIFLSEGLFWYACGYWKRQVLITSQTSKRFKAMNLLATSVQLMRPLTVGPVTFSIEFITPVKEQIYMMILIFLSEGLFGYACGYWKRQVLIKNNLEFELQRDVSIDGCYSNNGCNLKKKEGWKKKWHTRITWIRASSKKQSFVHSEVPKRKFYSST